MSERRSCNRRPCAEGGGDRVLHVTDVPRLRTLLLRSCFGAARTVEGPRGPGQRRPGDDAQMMSAFGGDPLADMQYGTQGLIRPLFHVWGSPVVAGIVSCTSPLHSAAVLCVCVCVRVCVSVCVFVCLAIVCVFMSAARTVDGQRGPGTRRSGDDTQMMSTFAGDPALGMLDPATGGLTHSPVPPLHLASLDPLSTLSPTFVSDHSQCQAVRHPHCFKVVS